VQRHDVLLLGVNPFQDQFEVTQPAIVVDHDQRIPRTATHGFGGKLFCTRQMELIQPRLRSRPSGRDLL
jgi:hypothetical protein